MEYLIKDTLLELKYEPGKGAWTYQFINEFDVRNTKKHKSILTK